MSLKFLRALSGRNRCETKFGFAATPPDDRPRPVFVFGTDHKFVVMPVRVIEGQLFADTLCQRAVTREQVVLGLKKTDVLNLLSTAKKTPIEVK